MLCLSEEEYKADVFILINIPKQNILNTVFSGVHLDPNHTKHSCINKVASDKIGFVGGGKKNPLFFLVKFACKFPFINFSCNQRNALSSMLLIVTVNDFCC